MTEQDKIEANKACKLSILIAVLPHRGMMFNNLYQELYRQIDMGGYKGKGLEKWIEDTPALDENGVQKLTEEGSPIFNSVQRQFKHPDKVEIILAKKNQLIGDKRNELLEKSLGEYVCFVDDDDWVSRDYVKTIMESIEANKPDCVSLRGEMTTDGQKPEIFEHSLKYDSWRTTGNPIKYERYPNHLNAIRADIAKQFKFPSVSHGEDHNWSTQIHNSKLLKTEVYIDKVLYQYRFISNKQVA